jgi:hypothetical protein
MSEEEEDIKVPSVGLEVARESLELEIEFSTFYL